MSDVRYILDHVNHDALVGSESGIGAWQALVTDSGWTTSIRYRLVPLGLQLTGALAGDIPANARARVGQLPEGYRPVVTQGFLAAVIGTLVSSYGTYEVWTDGTMYTQWAVSGLNNQLVLSVTIAMD